MDEEEPKKIDWVGVLLHIGWLACFAAFLFVIYYFKHMLYMDANG